MHVTETAPGIYRMSANVYDEIHFEGIWPLPTGIAMNSYIVRGDRCAVIDGVCGWDGVPETLIAQFAELGIRPEDIDAVVLNHLEPDHTGWLDAFKRLNDRFELYASAKGVELANEFYGITERLHAVKSGDSLDLGQGKRLVFQETPNVHWPETIMTFETGTGTLFSGDAFGSFGAVTDAPYDEQLDDSQHEFFEKETLRYFSNIIGAFSVFVERAIRKVEPLGFRIVAPAHGVVWRKDPGRIVRLYREFASWSVKPVLPEVTVIWGSMYGNTEKALRPLVEGIESEDVTAHVHRVPETHASFVIQSAWRSSGIVLGMPTYEYHMFPPMAAVLEDLGRKRVQNRLAFRFGSFGWSGGAQKELEELQQRLKMNWQFLPPVEFKGRPKPHDFQTLFERGAELARGVKSITPTQA
jgi:anaerobic nitric oxide reductase flavorubredoxin